MINNFEVYREYCQALDLEFSEEIMEKLGQFGDDKDTGNRSAGSKASYCAAKYLYNKFNEAGLKNVSMDKFQVNGWTYKGANLIYKDNKGLPHKIVLGGYASNIKAVNEEVSIVDGGRGTIDELKALGDIKDKLVLVSVLNPMTDYWINLPAYEAYLRGAKGILIALTWKIEHDNILISFDLQAPAYCSTLAISIKDVKMLKQLINASPCKEIKALFNADSTVKPYANSYNVVGEIKGKTPEIIYLIAHYDGYYHSFFDDANGVSVILGISKALIDSNYTPTKTIRVIAQGAEEWGQGSKDYDWACGSYYEIGKLHPELREKAFALINFDGNFPIAKERNFRIYSSYELYTYAKKFIQLYTRNSGYNYETVCPSLMLADDFAYYKNAVPTLMTGDNFENSIYYNNYYHSTMDNKKAGFDLKTYEMIHKLYGRLILSLDSLPIKPFNFNTRFEIMKKELFPSIISDDLKNAVEEMCCTSRSLTQAIESAISEYNNLKTKSSLTCKPIIEHYSKINFMLFKLLKKIQDSFLAFTWQQDFNTLTFPHSVSMNNINLLNHAISSLKSKSEPLSDIVNKYIKPIDNNRYVFEFSRKTYDFFSYRIPYGNSNCFGSNMIKKPNEDLYDLAHLLKSKYNQSNPDVTDEIVILENSLQRQCNYLKEISQQEIEDLNVITKLMQKIIDVLS